MAHYEQVLRNLEEAGVQIRRTEESIAAMFPATISRHNLVALTADLLSSEELPFNGNYVIMDRDESVELEIWNL